MRIGCVIDHQIDDHADAALTAAMGELDEVAQSTVPGIDAIIVGDVVAVVLARRWLERHQPDRGDAEALQIIQPAQQSFEVADAVAVGIHISADGQAVENRVLVPEIVDHPTQPSAIRYRRRYKAARPSRVPVGAVRDTNRFPLCRARSMFVRMESPIRHLNLVPPLDRRQSETALAIARGTARLLRSLGFSCVSELPLPSGRRADLVALNERGEIWIVEIKSSVEDLRADQKWQDYRAHCDRLYFAFN